MACPVEFLVKLEEASGQHWQVTGKDGSFKIRTEVGVVGIVLQLLGSAEDGLDGWEIILALHVKDEQHDEHMGVEVLGQFCLLFPLLQQEVHRTSGRLEAKQKLDQFCISNHVRAAKRDVQFQVK